MPALRCFFCYIFQRFAVFLLVFVSVSLFSAPWVSALRCFHWQVPVLRCFPCRTFQRFAAFPCSCAVLRCVPVIGPQRPAGVKRTCYSVLETPVKLGALRSPGNYFLGRAAGIYGVVFIHLKFFGGHVLEFLLFV